MGFDSLSLRSSNYELVSTLFEQLKLPKTITFLMPYVVLYYYGPLDLFA